MEAVESGRDAVDEGDINSAVNRAYYAMFNATRAYLKAMGEPVDGSHGSIVQQLGKQLVLTGKVDRDVGRTFNRLQEARSIADYGVAQVPSAEAEAFVASAEAFVDQVAGLLGPAVPAGWSRRTSRREQVIRILASAFCTVASAKGETLPPGFEDALVVYGSPATLSDMLANVGDMTDLASYVAGHLPGFVP